MSKINRRHALGKENVKNGEDISHAKAAPDFSKLHKQWDKKLQKGKAVKKKPLTSIQPFQLSQIPSRTSIQNDTKFKVDTKSKENILNCHGIADNNGRSTTTTRSSSTTAHLSKSGIPRFSKPPQLTTKLVVVSDIKKPAVVTNVVKPVVVSDVAKPAVKRSLLPQLSSNVKKTQPIQDFQVDFECDKFALDSILNGEGIALLSTSPSRLSTKCGPTRRDHGKKCNAPYQKPVANSRLSDRSRVVPGNLEAANAAKKRWSIYNRDSFCTKVDLMTWLKQLAGLPSTTSDNSQSSTSNSPVMTISKTSAINHVSGSTSSETDNVSTVRYSTSSSGITTSCKSTNLKPIVTSSLPNMLTQGSISLCDPIIPHTKQSLFSSNVVLHESSFKFNSSVVGYQGFDNGLDEESRNGNKDLRCPTFLTPEKIHVKPRKIKPTVTKSILKKSSLCCIEEVAMEKVTDKNIMINELNERRIKEIRTPTRGNKITPIKAGKTPIRSAQRRPPSSANEKTQPVRATVCSATRATPENIKPVRATISNTTRTYTTTGSSTPRKHTDEKLVVSEQNYQNAGEFICPTGNVDSETFMCRITDNSFVKDSQENSNKKRVHWNNDLTYLSPVDVTPADDLLNESMSTLLHRRCAVQLFHDDMLTNPNDTLECTGAITSSCEEPLDLTMSNVSSSYVLPDMKRNQESIASKSNSCIVCKPTSPLAFNNILINTSVTSCGVLSTKSVTSHQIKYIIPAEQPLEKSQSPNEEKETVKSTCHSFPGETDGHDSVQSWADILGNKYLANNINPINSLNPVSSNGNCISHLPITNISCPTSDLNTLVPQKDKSKKKKRYSILDRIYGDPNKSLDTSLHEKSAFKETDNLNCNTLYNIKSSAHHVASSVKYSSNTDTLRYVLGNKYSQNSFIGSPAMLRCQGGISHNPATVVTYSKNASNISYGDLPENILQPSPFPLIMFSSEKKNEKSSKELFITNFVKNENQVGKNNSLPREDMSVLFGSSTVSNGATSTCPQDISLPLYSEKGMVVCESNHNTPQSFLRSVKLDKYVTSLLDSPANSSVVRDIHPLITFSVEKKNEESSKELFITNFVKNENQIGKNSSLPQGDVSFSFGSSTASNKTTATCLHDVNLPVYSKKGMGIHESNHITPQSFLRSVKLNDYVTSLLDSPANLSVARDTHNSIKLDHVLHKSPCLEKSGTISTNISSNLTSHSFLDDTDDSNDSCSPDNSDSDVCMVFSTPFKRGLYNHILQTNSVIGIPKDIQQETTKHIAFTPTQNLNDICHEKSSAFRRIPPTCNIFPKNIATTTITKKSDEMQALVGITSPVLSPDKHTKVEDAEVSLYHQFGEISSRFHKNFNVIRGGGQNPLSLILTVGDEMHFVPIDAETILKE